MVAIFEGSVNPNHFVVWISFCFPIFQLRLFFTKVETVKR